MTLNQMKKRLNFAKSAKYSVWNEWPFGQQQKLNVTNNFETCYRIIHNDDCSVTVSAITIRFEKC